MSNTFIGTSETKRLMTLWKNDLQRRKNELPKKRKEMRRGTNGENLGKESMKSGTSRPVSFLSFFNCNSAQAETYLGVAFARIVFWKARGTSGEKGARYRPMASK